MVCMLFLIVTGLLRRAKPILFSNKRMNAVGSSLESIPLNISNAKSGCSIVFAIFFFLKFSCSNFVLNLRLFHFNLVFKLLQFEFSPLLLLGGSFVCSFLAPLPDSFAYWSFFDPLHFKFLMLECLCSLAISFRSNKFGRFCFIGP